METVFVKLIAGLILLLGGSMLIAIIFVVLIASFAKTSEVISWVVRRMKARVRERKEQRARRKSTKEEAE